MTSFFSRIISPPEPPEPPAPSSSVCMAKLTKNGTIAMRSDGEFSFTYTRIETLTNDIQEVFDKGALLRTRRKAHSEFERKPSDANNLDHKEWI